MNGEFQTPDWVCDLMVNMIPITDNPKVILEPTPGEGNLVRAIQRRFSQCRILAPNDIYLFHPKEKIDWTVSNPPFTPMSLGFSLLQRMKIWCDNIVILLPWLLLINSEERTDWFLRAGLSEVIHLPRSVFGSSRVQACVMKMTPRRSKEEPIELTFAAPQYIKRGGLSQTGAKKTKNLLGVFE